MISELLQGHMVDDLLALLPLLNTIVAAEVRREAGEDTTMPQYRVLALLADGPLTLSALAKQRRVSVQSMGELMQVLVERGWVERTPDPRDRRQHLLTPTAAGRAHYEQAQALMVARLEPLFQQLSEHERAAIAVALPALRRVLVRTKDGGTHGG